LSICKVKSDITEERDAELFKLLSVAVYIHLLSVHDIQRRLPLPNGSEFQFKSRKGIIYYTHLSKWALEPIQRPVNWVLGSLLG